MRVASTATAAMMVRSHLMRKPESDSFASSTGRVLFRGMDWAVRFMVFLRWLLGWGSLFALR
ncbi:hypothetical protein ACFFX0_08835 [Citricoccus parietis]|uniref:Uncharacterized protein n=1 Tax=Citricoccus parietis TaxID=592307 RepID=A0ABV5FX99_9MICC